MVNSFCVKTRLANCGFSVMIFLIRLNSTASMPIPFIICKLPQYNFRVIHMMLFTSIILPNVARKTIKRLHIFQKAVTDYYKVIFIQTQA